MESKAFHLIQSPPSSLLLLRFIAAAVFDIFYFLYFHNYYSFGVDKCIPFHIFLQPHCTKLSIIVPITSTTTINITISTVMITSKILISQCLYESILFFTTSALYISYCVVRSLFIESSIESYVIKTEVTSCLVCA